MTSPFLNDDPTAALFVQSGQSPAVPVRYRSGRLVEWDVRTGVNVVLVDGVEFTNLPVLVGSYLGVMQPGDVVSLLSTTDDRGVSTYAIQGMSLNPPDIRVPRAAGRLGFAISQWDPGTLAGTVTSSSYIDFAGTDVVSLFKAAEDSIVIVTHELTLYTAASDAAIGLGVLVDGATDVTVLEMNVANELFSAHTSVSRTVAMPALAAGSHTFQPRWKRIGGTGTGTVDSGDSFTMKIREVLV